MRPPPQIVAHRGLHRDCPENSLQAFGGATQAGVDWIECDVWMTADGRAVVLHDDTLERTTDGAGFVRDQAWSTLGRLHLRDASGKVRLDQTLPDLGGVIEVLRAADARSGGICADGARAGASGARAGADGVAALLVEIKPPDAPDLVRLVIDQLRASGARFMVQSFDSRNLEHALSHDADVPHAMLVEDRVALALALARKWKAIHMQHEMLDEETSAAMGRAGIACGVWTVNAPAAIRRAAALGAAMIITDVPLIARAALNRATA